VYFVVKLYGMVVQEG